ncbi:MAG: hydroxymethylbilane synthase [Methylocella sp.]
MRVGTRGSALALAQTQWVIARLRKAHSDQKLEVKKIKTSGDRIMGDLTKEGSKGLFVKEIEEALLAGEIDLSVHSMKDLTAELPKGLAIGAVPKREDPRDALVGPFEDLDNLPIGARVGTGSLRRSLQLKALRPDVRIVPVRGNVDTRLQKLDAGQYDAVILAVAGLSRLGLKERIGLKFEPEAMIPAIGQGALALEIREDDAATRETVRTINHDQSEECVFAERSFLKRIGGSCHTPLAGYATLSRDRKTMNMIGMVAGPVSGRILKETIEEWEDSPDELGESLAEQLIEAGAEEILSEAV